MCLRNVGICSNAHYTVTTEQKIRFELSVVYYKNHRGKRKYSLCENVDNINLGAWGTHRYKSALNWSINVKQTQKILY